MTQFTNIAQAFPLEKLGSDIARNEFNYQSILNGLVEWDKTTADTVNIRLTKETDPWFEDFTIPSKTALFDLDSIDVSTTTSVESNSYAVDHVLDMAASGGSFTFDQTTFDGETDVDVTENTVTVIDNQGFALGDMVVFGTNGGTLPGGLTATNQFKVKTVANNVFTFYDEDDEDVVITVIGSGTITMTKIDMTPPVDETDVGDTVTFRLTMNDNGLAEWQVNYYQLISTWTSGTRYSFGNLVYSTVDATIYKVISDISSSINSPANDNDTAHFEPLIREWTLGEENYSRNDLVSHEGSLYKVISTSISSADASPPNALDEYELYATKWVSESRYEKGEMVFYEGNPYIANELVENSTTTPVAAADEEIWEMAVLFPIPTMPSFTDTIVGRWQASVNVSKFVLRNIFNAASTGDTNINMRTSLKTRDPDSIYQKSVDVFPTSNYAFWPNDKTAIWNLFTENPATDDSIPISQRQDYSSVMMFDHTNAADAKTVNYVNYDGPDLDQGLCIYLPVEAPVGEQCIACPEDGFTYEFFFRIWPNTEYTSAVTRDHIINKSHIYVYSAPTVDDVKNNNCGNPIAKFSMARLTNFYVFGENISVPDKPVCYRATFIYSTVERRWITLDYYQLPDHVFLGPIGFVDPQSPGNLDLNNDVIGGINPNAQTIGYETGAFPLFQDPFSNPDLSPYRVSGDEELDIFRNRII